MRRDPTEFRARFKAYKEGKKPYNAGRPVAIQEVDKSDADFAKRLRSNWRLEIWDWEGSGKAVTHKIGSSDNIVYPNVQTTEGGGLIDFTNPIWKGVVDPRQRAIQHGDFVPMKTESDAIWFGPNYKKYYPGFKNGKLPKFAEGTGGVENNITEEYTPIVSDTYQSTINKLKQQTAAFNVDDYVYVAKKLHPEITKELVMNVYNNTPYVASDSSRGSTLGLYRHGEDDGYGRGITIYPRRMRPDGPDFNLEDRIKSNMFHESHHLFRDMLFGGKYTDEESKYLRLAIPDAINDNERAARIREARGNLNIQTGATGKKLDDAVDKMSSKEAKFHYSRLNSSEANTSGWNPLIEDAFRWALKNIASTQIKPKQGLLLAKDGKLPGYEGGKIPYVASDGTQYNIDPNVVGSDQINITTPDVVVTGTDRRPMYQRYDAENSTYDPNAVRMFTDWAPVVGDVGQSLDAYNAFKNKDYTTAAILGGLTVLPNVAENFGKYTYKGLRQLGVSQDFAKDILLNGEAAWKRFKNLDIFDKFRGIKYTDDVYHGSKNAFDINHARAYAPAGMDTGFHMGSSPTPAYSRANGLLGGALYSGKLKLKEAPFELDDLNRWGWREIIAEADNNPKFKKYLEDKGIDLDRLLNTALDLEKEYDNLDSFGQQVYLKEHGGFESDKYMAKLFKDKNVSFKYKNKFETFDGVPEYSYAIYNPDNVVWNRPFLFSERKLDLEKLYDIGMAGKYYWNDPDKITILLDDLYRVLKDFPLYRLPGFKNGKLPGYKNGKIHIKPANRGKFTALKKRTGHSASWFKENGTPAQKKMAVFALNAKKWKH